MFELRSGNFAARLVEDHEPGAGGALVERADVAMHVRMIVGGGRKERSVREEGETGERGGRGWGGRTESLRGYFTQSSQRAEGEPVGRRPVRAGPSIERTRRITSDAATEFACDSAGPLDRCRATRGPPATSADSSVRVRGMIL